MLYGTEEYTKEYTEYLRGIGYFLTNIGSTGEGYLTPRRYQYM